MAVLRGKPGEPWEQVSITAADGSSSPLFLGRDENPKSQKTRFLTKKAKTVLQEMAPNKTWFGKDGKISAAWKPVVEIVPSFEGAPTIHFSRRGLAFHELDRTVLEPRLRAAVGETREDMEWCL